VGCGIKLGSMFLIKFCSELISRKAELISIEAELISIEATSIRVMRMWEVSNLVEHRSLDM
jgi:hypothetical protein